MRAVPDSSGEDRRRVWAMAALFVAVACAATAYISANVTNPLIARSLLGSARWSGAPTALTIFGAAVGTSVLSLWIARFGRRSGLTLGFVVATIGAVAAATAVHFGLFPAYLVAILAFGTGSGASHLSRYAAGELYPLEQRGRAIAVIVWAGTIGSVAGPSLLEPARRFAAHLGVVELAGPLLVASSGMALAAMIVGFSPAPKQLTQAVSRTSLVGSMRLLRQVAVIRALIILICGQGAMVLIMAMTPLHIHGAGEGLATVGWVIGGHTFGMFALSPLSGWLSDRLGRRATVVGGSVMIIVSALVASQTHGGDRVALVVALFLLGWGWNLGFVAGSAIVSESTSGSAAAQGLADSLVWTTSASASLMSGVLLAAFGYQILCLAGMVLGAIPLLAITAAGIRSRSGR